MNYEKSTSCRISTLAMLERCVIEHASKEALKELSERR